MCQNKKAIKLRKFFNMENDTDRQKPIWKEGMQNILTRN
jgi:hypothetical protein